MVHRAAKTALERLPRGVEFAKGFGLGQQREAGMADRMTADRRKRVGSEMRQGLPVEAKLIDECRRLRPAWFPLRVSSEVHG